MWNSLRLREDYTAGQVRALVSRMGSESIYCGRSVFLGRPRGFNRL
jgi:hypothetical protein